MPNTGLIIGGLFFCIIVIVSVVLGLYFGNVACPSFGANCTPAPRPGIPSAYPAPSPRTPSGTPGPSPGPSTCPSGQWKRGTTCTACTTTAPANKYVSAVCTSTSDTQFRDMVSCGQGYVRLDSDSGSYHGLGSAGRCASTYCSPGTYQTAYGEPCQTCPAGSYCPGGALDVYGNNKYNCAAGTYSTAGQSSCTACPSGQTSGIAAPSCYTPQQSTISTLSGLACPSGYVWNTSKLQCCETANPTNCGDPTAPHHAYCSDDGTVHASDNTWTNMTGDNPSCGIGQRCVWNNCFLNDEGSGNY